MTCFFIVVHQKWVNGPLWGKQSNYPARKDNKYFRKFKLN